jgi:hypothetical protein
MRASSGWNDCAGVVPSASLHFDSPGRNVNRPERREFVACSQSLALFGPYAVLATLYVVTRQSPADVLVD